MKTLQTKFYTFLFLAMGFLFITSCQEELEDPCLIMDCPNGYMCDNGVCINPGEQRVRGNITENTTWTADKTWVLDGRIIVVPGVTLTIEPGTVIKGEIGTDVNASTLVIARGAKINAAGTAAKPIIFTSIGDDVISGEIAGNTLNYEKQAGFWGGLLILGDAPISVPNGNVAQIEGIPGSVLEGEYGGDNPMDDSGVLTYVSIRYGGTLIGSGNEINGLTLAGVGAGTTIHHIEVVANVDDGIEWFGGTVNCSDLIVVAQGDDAFDIDQAYSGNISNIISIAGRNSDHSFEIDGPEGLVMGSFDIQNATLVGNNITPNGEFADFRDGARGSINNCWFTGFQKGKDIEIDDEDSFNNYVNGDLTMTNLEFDSNMGYATLSEISNEKSGGDSEEAIFDTQFESENFLMGTKTAGANAAEFHSWSFSSAKGLLNGL